jgi:Rrf2 family protein|tara:strand:- start:292 stop:732 length:441 start_codon:yes stop_codon:yes gene_type:complete
MKISAKTRYGVRLMLLLALNYGKGPLLLKEISRREGISEKYLGQIIIPLKSAGLVTSIRGAHGGYELGSHPAEMTVKDITEVLEGGLKLTEKVNGFSSCSRATFCTSRFIWEVIEKNMKDALEAITLEDLVLKYGENKKNSIMYNI